MVLKIEKSESFFESVTHTMVDTLYPIFAKTISMDTLKERKLLTAEEQSKISSSPYETRKMLQEVVERLYKEEVLDERHYFTLSTLLSQYDMAGAIQLLNGLSSLQYLEQITDITAVEYSQMIDMLEHVFVKGFFREGDLEKWNTRVTALKVAGLKPRTYFQTLALVRSSINRFSVLSSR